MTKTQAEEIVGFSRPAPANDFITIPITMTREEWRAIEAAANTLEMESEIDANYIQDHKKVSLRRGSFFISAWTKIRRSIVARI